MEQDISLDIEAIKHRSIHGLAALIIRTFFIQAFTFFATFILTVILAPSVFGVFFVVSAIINFFVYFSDIGLAAALIQKKDQLTSEDLSSTFTIQQTIIVTLVVLGLIFSSTIGKFYGLDSSGLVLLRVLIFSLFLSSLKTIPSIILERKLLFAKLVIPQIAENLVFYTTAIVLAIQGFGILSFAWAVLLRGIAGIVVVYIVSPWKPSFKFDKEVAKKLVSFGVPFQLNSILALLKDDLLIIILGKVLSFTQLGYIGWGQKWAFTPLRFFMDNVIKVTFPSYSRLQDHKEYLEKAIDKSLFFVTFTVFPSVLGMMAVAPRIVDLIPKYQKWEAAIPLLYLYGINALFASVNTTLTNIIFALGKPKIILKLMVFWTILTWFLTYVLLIKYGYIGVAIASMIVAASTSVIIYYVKKEVNTSIIKSIYVPVLSSLGMFIVLIIANKYLPGNVLSLFLIIIIGVVTYLSVAFLFLKQKLFADIDILYKSLFKRT
jgi:O-antigen/teichoic acid export membrane protein